jgi:hypothetical protein
VTRLTALIEAKGIFAAVTNKLSGRAVPRKTLGHEHDCADPCPPKAKVTSSNLVGRAGFNTTDFQAFEQGQPTEQQPL